MQKGKIQNSINIAKTFPDEMQNSAGKKIRKQEMIFIFISPADGRLMRSPIKESIPRKTVLIPFLIFLPFLNNTFNPHFQFQIKRWI